jgi:EAL domain-containing protein (putative c-di-GMP-specific phosphodiesterase class I)
VIVPTKLPRAPDAGRADGRVLRVLIGVAVVNGLITLFGPAWVIVRGGGAAAPIGPALYLCAIAATALTPLELGCLWFALGGRVREMRTNKRAAGRICEVLRSESIATAFQPIFDLDTCEVVGAEALTRFTVEPFTTPDVWFADAERAGYGLEMELLAIRTAISNVSALPADLYVALNVSPATLASPQLLATLLGSGLATTRLVVEVTEHTSIPDYAPLREAREGLRKHGIRLAVDDAGSGYASFRHIVALAPDIIKLDRELIAGIDHDEAGRALVAAVVMYALEAGAVLIAEGVETAAELGAIEALGVDAAQGYHLGRPTSVQNAWVQWEQTSVILRAGAERAFRPSRERASAAVASAPEPPDEVLAHAALLRTGDPSHVVGQLDVAVGDPGHDHWLALAKSRRTGLQRGRRTHEGAADRRRTSVDAHPADHDAPDA